VLLNFFLYTQRRGVDAPAEKPLMGFAQISFTMWTILVLPLYIALAAALVAGLDHQSNGWQRMFSLPIARGSLFGAKWIATAGLVLLSTLTFSAAICVGCELLRLFKPAFRLWSPPIGLVMRRSMQTFAAAGLVIALQTWVSLRWRSFLSGLSLGVAGVLVLLGGVARAGLGTFVVYVYPWALPPTAMARMWESHPDRWIATWWGLAGGVLVAFAGCWELSRREF
jgi:lantibiotic transport system permease protein